MNELNIEKFSPTKAELTKMAETAATITLPDPLDKEQVEVVKQARLGLRSARTAITKMGKDLREDAVKFQKAVIVKEKEMLAIIEPQEERLERLEQDAEHMREREDRREFLPRRKERLTAIGDGIEITEDELLDMDGSAFEGYINMRHSNKLAADKAKLAADQAKLDADKAKLEHDKELAAAEERGRKEAAEKLEREAKEKAEREAREKEETDRKEAAEKEKRERDESYQAFLKKYGYEPDEDKFWTVQHGNEVRLYKHLATFNQAEKVEIEKPKQ